MILSNGALPPIGGYFELELPLRRSLPYANLLRFQSARAAFLALLRSGKPRRVWMPKYICNAMLAPLQKADVECAWYNITDELEVEPRLRISDGDWLLYVNYYGVCGSKVEALLDRFPPDQVVLDYSQSFFRPPHKKALATIYSPRKFFGVPDGGLLYSKIAISSPLKVDNGSLNRADYLLKRLAGQVEEGYLLYQQAEESLSDIEPKRMSLLTERILMSIDLEAARQNRLENFRFLYKHLGDSCGLLSGMDELDVPLCYPFLSQDDNLRNHLIHQGIFVPTYWVDALHRLPPKQADTLIRKLLPLPIDQRYCVTDMERIMENIWNNQ